ncbi:MAG: PEP-CTERM sorting domain-containing protein [Desulfovermiculus sp.]|nr:PEP-CTERM sorting domain-containing protein [Desulfovermiculus sp.]
MILQDVNKQSESFAMKTSYYGLSLSKLFRRSMMIVLFLGLVSSQAFALSYTGSLSVNNDTLVVTDNNPGINNNSNYSPPWQGAVFSWEVTENTENNDGTWNYSYTWNSGGTPALSHIIIEVSEGFSIENDMFYADPNDPVAHGNNPNYTFTSSGVKWDVGEETTEFTFSFNSDRAPMWGDMLAVGGQVIATNSNNGTDPANVYALGENIVGWALVPDTKTSKVPEPATMLLLGSGLIMLGIVGRKQLHRNP